MRIVHVLSSSDPKHGGPSAAIAGLASALVRPALSVEVASAYRAGADNTIAHQMESAGCTVTMIGPCHGPLGHCANMRDRLQESIATADIVHIHALWEEIQHQAAVICRKLAKPYIFTPHGMLDHWSLNQSRWKKRLYMAWRLRRDLNGAAAIHYTADLEREGAAPLKLKAPAIVEPNGLDLSEFAELPPRGFLGGRHPQLADKKILLFLSRIHHKKGLDLLIPAFGRVVASNPSISDWMLVVAGPDPDGYGQQMQQLAVEKGIGPRVLFTGMLHGRERIAAYVDAEVFCLPSYQENFGIVVAESLAAGTPVIISDQVAIHPEISRADVGAVVPTQIEPLAQTLSKWLTSPELRQAAAGRARPFVQERYDWSRIAARWCGHYRRLAGFSTDPT